uniref:AT-rich interactive domain-containing protein 3 n=1 Tax=Varanus komodoensis TaxID=61221 RepID=A0A8D2LP75_VARKO
GPSLSRALSPRLAGLRSPCSAPCAGPPWKTVQKPSPLQNVAAEAEMKPRAQITVPCSAISDLSPHRWSPGALAARCLRESACVRATRLSPSLPPSLPPQGTPVNRIPIMAKQVLDLFTLYRLVTEKGGLVEVINKKIWREITKGLNLPTSITSAAFTLRTQYMKYLYPYECDKRGLSSPGELQAAIDSNRREGRRQAFGTALFSYSPVGTPVGVLSPPKITMPSLTISTHSCGQVGPVHTIKKESILSAAVPGRIAIPVSLAAALEQLREKLEAGEPPEKKMADSGEPRAAWSPTGRRAALRASPGRPPPSSRRPGISASPSFPDDRQEAALNLSTNGISSINMSIEINGVVYTAGPLPPRIPSHGPFLAKCTKVSSRSSDIQTESLGMHRLLCGRQSDIHLQVLSLRACLGSLSRGEPFGTEHASSARRSSSWAVLLR